MKPDKANCDVLVAVMSDKSGKGEMRWTLDVLQIELGS